MKWWDVKLGMEMCVWIFIWNGDDWWRLEFGFFFLRWTETVVERSSPLPYPLRISHFCLPHIITRVFLFYASSKLNIVIKWFMFYFRKTWIALHFFNQTQLQESFSIKKGWLRGGLKISLLSCCVSLLYLNF